MVSWQRYMVHGLHVLEETVDDWRFGRLARTSTHQRPMIVPYIGHTNGKQLFMRGRVLLDKHIAPASEADSTWTNFKNTLKRFETDEIPYARVRATVNGHTQEIACNSEGFFRVHMQFNEPLQNANGWQAVRLQVIDTPVNQLDISNTQTTGHVIAPAANAQFGVVSDLDDTVLRTDVLNPLKMLNNTLLRNAHTREPFDGVATFYRALQRGTHQTTNPIFYVSSSPWNLYDVIIDFYKLRHIPLGPIYLRDIGLTREQLVAKGHMAHKLETIERLLNVHSQLPFILIGDSGQRDIWVYQAVVEKYPGRIAAVYIRNVTGAGRAHVIEHIAAQIRGAGVPTVFAQNTYDAAQHAVQYGHITEEALYSIAQACGKAIPQQF